MSTSRTVVCKGTTAAVAMSCGPAIFDQRAAEFCHIA